MKSVKRNRIQISVVIPAYNEEKLIRRCIKSIKNQKFQLPYEIIVVNNNSTDQTEEIAKEEGVKVVFEKSKGISAARQKGLEVSNGEIVAQTDADSVPDENWLKEIYSVLSSDEKLIGVSGPSYNYERNKTFSDNVRRFLFDFLAFKVASAILGNGTFRGHNVAFRKHALLEVGGYRKNVEYLEDADMNIRLRKIGKIIYNPNQIVITSMRRIAEEGAMKILFYQVWCSLRLYFEKNPTIKARNYR